MKKNNKIVVTLVQPKLSDGSKNSKDWNLCRPLSLGYIEAALNKYTDSDVNIIDFECPLYNSSSYIEILKKYPSTIFGVTCTTPSRHEAIALIKAIKMVYPNSLLIVGGPHFMSCIEDTFINIPEIDLIVRGEGEIPMINIVSCLEKEMPFDSVKSISYRSKETIIHNPEETEYIDLNELDMSATYPKYYIEDVMGYPAKIPALSMMSSRGCPFNCIFCSKRKTKVRFKDPCSVVDEIQELVSLNKIEGINFLDLAFTHNFEYVTKLCDELIQRNLGIKWWCESRVNIPIKLLALMKKAGCVSIAIGCESGSKKILKTIRKNISPEDVIKFCEECNKLNIYVTAMFIVSHPGEAFSDYMETYKLIKTINSPYVNTTIQPMMIFPGTELDTIARENGILPKKFSWYENYKNKTKYVTELGLFEDIPPYLEDLSYREIRWAIMNKPNFNKDSSQEKEIKVIISQLKRYNIHFKGLVDSYLLKKKIDH